MSRSGYSDDGEDGWQLIMWRGAVASAIRGRRGQAFLKEMLAALDAMPVKRLVADDLEKDGEVCAIGSVGKARGTPMAGIDPEDYGAIAKAFGISEALAREAMFVNDESWFAETTPEARFTRVRAWVAAQIKENA